MTNTPAQPASAHRGIDAALWIVQGLLALTFVGTGLWKLVTPTAALASKMPWMGQVSPGFLLATAALDLAVGLGVLLPSLTRVMPRLAVASALGGAGLMAGAVVFHVQRGEAASTPFNVLLALLACFVAWGRLRKAPIAPRAPRA